MVDIFNAEIAGGGPAGQRDFRIDVTYRAVFDPAERNLEFSEFVRLRESDEVGVDDDLTPANPVSFVPGTETVGRRISINVPREVLDTEFGEEEVYAEVWLCAHPRTSLPIPSKRKHVLTAL